MPATPQAALAEPASSATPVPPNRAASPAPTTAPSPTAIPTATPQAALDPALAAELQHVLDQLVADGFIPGAVLAVHIPGYAPWAGASGFVDRRRSQPIAPTTEVRIASISKVFTAVVVLQLIEERKLDLDAPVATWVPDLIPHAERTTVRNVLNHTSGLYDYLEDKHFLGRAFRMPDYTWLPEELVDMPKLEYGLGLMRN